MPTPTVQAFGTGEVILGPYPDIATLAAVLPATGHGGRIAAVGAGVGSYIYLQSMNGIWCSLGCPQLTTAGAAGSYFKGGQYFDLTLNKLRIGGASGWETVTSA